MNSAVMGSLDTMINHPPVMHRKCSDHQPNAKGKRKLSVLSAKCFCKYEKTGPHECCGLRMYIQLDQDISFFRNISPGLEPT